MKMQEMVVPQKQRLNRGNLIVNFGKQRAAAGLIDEGVRSARIL